MSEKSKNFAVLIDADNTSHQLIGSILEEIAKYGTACVKYIYGDWSEPALKSWKEKCLGHGLIAVQQFSYTSQKNATDIAMVIDAMDLLHSETFDGFCLVSSDSDFTGLAARIRRNGLIVYGLGKENTPEAFRKSCDKFIYTNNLSSENILENDAESVSAGRGQQPTKMVAKSGKDLRQDTKLVNLIRNAIKEHEDEEGWATLSTIGSYINKIEPEFDARNYGLSKLSSLIKAIGLFQHTTRGSQLIIKNNGTNKDHSSPNIDVALINKCQKIIKENQLELYDDWADFNDVGKALKEDAIVYKDLGFSTLSKLIAIIPNVEIKVTESKKFARLEKEG